MAGPSSRFLRAGYNQPKWKLPIDGRPLLDWALMSFESRFATETFVIAYLEGGDTQAFIRDRATAIGIRDMVFALLPPPPAAKLRPCMSPSRQQKPMWANR